MNDTAKTHAFTLYDTEADFIAMLAARQFKHNESAALRHIIMTYALEHTQEHAQ